MSLSEPDLSVVIPVYRSGEILPDLLDQISAVVEERGLVHEIILIDDASPDDTWSEMREFVPRYSNARAIRLMRNGGQAAATLCGLEMALGHLILTMDDDLQHPPDQIPILLEALEADPELDGVFGVSSDKKHSFQQNLGSRILSWVNARSFGLPRGLRSSSFRLLRRSVGKAAVEHRTLNPALSAILYSSTARLKSIPVRHERRKSGASGYTLGRQIRLAWDNITNVSMLPLRLVTVFGSVFCFFGLIMAGHTLFKYFSGQIAVPGWTTVVILLSFFSGVTLLALGIIGEYLGRILREVRGSPRFIIREELPGSREQR
jgi:dolichol-phosphate mannosyltransferase/undecaprenyl-phosphate 4-deoxy-4-formamido-L-arabinose transferase